MSISHHRYPLSFFSSTSSKNSQEVQLVHERSRRFTIIQPRTIRQAPVADRYSFVSGRVSLILVSFRQSLQGVRGFSMGLHPALSSRLTHAPHLPVPSYQWLPCPTLPLSVPVPHAHGLPSPFSPCTLSWSGVPRPRFNLEREALVIETNVDPLLKMGTQEFQSRTRSFGH